MCEIHVDAVPFHKRVEHQQNLAFVVILGTSPPCAARDGCGKFQVMFAQKRIIRKTYGYVH